MKVEETVKNVAETKVPRKDSSEEFTRGELVQRDAHCWLF